MTLPTAMINVALGRVQRLKLVFVTATPCMKKQRRRYFTDYLMACGRVKNKNGLYSSTILCTRRHTHPSSIASRNRLFYMIRGCRLQYSRFFRVTRIIWDIRSIFKRCLFCWGTRKIGKKDVFNACWRRAIPAFQRFQTLNKAKRRIERNAYQNGLLTASGLC